jgi:hypothetical protein
MPPVPSPVHPLQGRTGGCSPSALSQRLSTRRQRRDDLRISTASSTLVMNASLSISPGKYALDASRSPPAPRPAALHPLPSMRPPQARPPFMALRLGLRGGPVAAEGPKCTHGLRVHVLWHPDCMDAIAGSCQAKALAGCFCRRPGRLPSSRAFCLWGVLKDGSRFHGGHRQAAVSAARSSPGTGWERATRTRGWLAAAQSPPRAPSHRCVTPTQSHDDAASDMRWTSASPAL